jgi:Fe-S-cluster containining protein
MNLPASQQIDPHEADLWTQWHAAARTPAVSGAIQSLYADLDAAVRQRGPTCWTSGKCCKFDTFQGGHLLYVTGLEIAWVLAQPAVVQTGLNPAQVGQEGACAFQQQGKCTIHAVRPMGCRVFFCQQGTQDWQQQLYETFLTRLRQLHDEREIEYRYMEWRSGLQRATAHGLA